MTDEIKIGFAGELSIYRKVLKLTVNDVDYDISNLVPDEIWEMGGNEVFPKHPEIDWKIRCELIKIAREFVKSIDDTFPVEKIYG